MEDPTDKLRLLRVQVIEQLLRTSGSVTIAELSQHFGKTAVTIRRDLMALEERGIAKRTYGGAVLAEPIEKPIAPYHVRELVQAGAKGEIAREAARFVQDGDSLILNSGTTMQAFARELRHHKNLRVVTSGASLLAEFASSENAQVFLIGGEVDLRKLGSVGSSAAEYLRHIRVAKAFLSVAAVSAERGVFMHTQGHAALNVELIRASDEINLLVDSSKLVSHFFFQIATIRQITRIITDVQADPTLCEAIRKEGVEVVVAGEINAAPAKRAS